LGGGGCFFIAKETEALGEGGWGGGGSHLNVYKLLKVLTRKGGGQRGGGQVPSEWVQAAQVFNQECKFFPISEHNHPGLCQSRGDKLSCASSLNPKP